MAKFLLFDDDPGVLDSLKECLCLRGYEIITYDSPYALISAIKHGIAYDLLITDISIENSKYDGNDIAETSKRINPTALVFTMSGYGDYTCRYADRHIKKGLIDNFLRPIIARFPPNLSV